MLTVAFFGALFGPEGAFLKLPAIPPLDKTNFPYVVLFAVALIKWRGALRRGHAGRGVDLILLISVVAGFVTWQTNLDGLRYGTWRITTIESLTFNDGLQYGFDEVLSVGFPFILGRTLFRRRRDLLDLMHFLVVATLVQSVLLLVELRMSPVWHMWIYGYGAHSDFLQTIRWGGYRPMNFMAHGLALALFVCVGLLAAVVLAKIGVPIRKRWSPKRVAIGLTFALVLCKSTGALIYGVLLIPLLVKVAPEKQVRFAVVVAWLVALYPALRAFDVVPADELVQTAEDLFGEDRAQSLAFRFDNEEMLLDKARERLWFGWGGHGRSAVYDDEMGKENSVADGHWIIVLGLRGVVGMFTAFSFLLLPLFVVKRRITLFADPDDRRLVAGLAVICATVTLDLIPNGLFASYPYLLAGALFGVLQEVKKRDSEWRQVG
ncbi:MAG: hypothetical protein H6720_27935 [Sandaracinus sp.]|nr:hypothetical protein [Sandaracinus sp.]